jgi:hypothetical protein
MTKHHWKMLPAGGFDRWVMEIPDVGTEHNGPGCTVCGYTFCEHCDMEIVSKQNIQHSAWMFACPGPPPEGKKYDWPTEDHRFVPAEFPRIILKEGYEMINGKAQLVKNIDLGTGENSLL